MTAPNRLTVGASAAVVTVLAIYGSLVPLQYEALEFDRAIQLFRQIPFQSIGIVHRADWVANVLLFVPIAYLWSGALSLDSRSRSWRWLATAAVVVCATMLSVALEFTQLWFPRRTVSQNDIVAEAIGAAMGGLLWVTTGQSTVQWIRGYTAASRPKQQLDWLLEAYLIGFLIYSVLPLDLTLSSGELAAKFRQGRVLLVPFADLSFSWQSLYRVVRDVAVFIPIGVLLATWRLPASTPVRPVAITALLGALVAVAVEGAQLFVLSRFTAATDCLLGIVGAALGGFLVIRWHSSRGATSIVAQPRLETRRFLVWLGIAAGYALIVIVILCGPFAVAGTWDDWAERYRGFWAVPFSRLYTGSEYNAISDVLRKELLFGGFGALMAVAIAALKLPTLIRRMASVLALVLGAALAAGIEVLQVFLPPHVPDITDVILGTTGVLVGLVVAFKLVDAHDANR